MKKAILAVDAGGTKTKVAIIDDNKDICYQKIGGSGSPAVNGIKAIEYIISLIKEVYKEVKSIYQIEYIQMGISGLGTVANKHQFEQQLSNELQIPVSMENDVVLALYSVLEDKFNEGVLVLAGTGSACLGAKDLTTLLIGGWGHLLSESGSSYTAVRSLVINMIKDYELGKKISPLAKTLLERANLKEVNDLKVFMYNHTKDEIASYAKLISEYALKGDKEAINILKTSGIELAKSVEIIYQRLGLSNNAVVGFRGSFINNAPFVKEEFFKYLVSKGITLQEVSGSEDPIFGGYYMAKRKLIKC